MNKSVVVMVLIVGSLLFSGSAISRTVSHADRLQMERLKMNAGDVVDFSTIDQCNIIKENLKTFGQIESRIKSFGVYVDKDWVCHFEFDTRIDDCVIKGDVYRKDDWEYGPALNLCDTVRAAFLAGRKVKMYYDSTLTSTPPLLHIMTVDILSE